MPPRKRARAGSSAASTISRPPTRATSGTISPQKYSFQPPELPLDPWTDEQETSLFKAIIRWKPAGMHKHFRMMAISQYMREHGHTPANAPHTSIPGIWRKLKTLYDMEALDAREDSILDPDEEDANPRKMRFRAFSLPKREFGAKMFSRRLAPNPSSSPSALDRYTRSVTKPARKGSRSERATARASTVEDSEEGQPNAAVSTTTRPRASTRTTRSSVATPQPRPGTDVKASVSTKRKRAATRGEEADQDEVTGTEVDIEEERPDGSTTVGSPAGTAPTAGSKPGKTPAKPKGAPGATDLRRSTRKR